MCYFEGQKNKNKNGSPFLLILGDWVKSTCRFLERQRERERKENVSSHQLRYPTGNACKKESAFTIAQFFFYFISLHVVISVWLTVTRRLYFEDNNNKLPRISLGFSVFKLMKLFFF